MKFLLDESAELRLASTLEEAGHDVTVIARDYPHALPDHEVLEIACDEQRVLITNDRDFGELIFRQRLPHYGVIYFRLPDQPVVEKAETLRRILRDYSDQLSKFIVVTENDVRVRETRPS
jgi:predicted nuclease of predicted toxin-antitoxin system